MIIDGALFLIFVWSMLYFVAKSMYDDIFPRDMDVNKRKLALEMVGMFCFITVPIMFLYVCFEFVGLTVKIIWDYVRDSKTGNPKYGKIYEKEAKTK